MKGLLNDLWKYSNGEWIWISGNNTVNVVGVYGTQGIPSTSNYPGSRDFMGFGIDSFGSIWIFGGLGYDSANNQGEWKIRNINWITCLKGYLNDLWKYYNGSWTWISGNNTAGVVGVYGTQGFPSISNYPGARESMGFGIDSFDSIWIFGGYGYDSTGNYGEWKIRNIEWTTYIERLAEWSLEIL